MELLPRVRQVPRVLSRRVQAQARGQAQVLGLQCLMEEGLFLGAPLNSP